MTINEEIQDAMRHGSSAMFLYGLLAYYKKEPQRTMQAVEMAANRLLAEREVKLGKAYAKSLLPPPRKYEPEREQEW